QASPENGPPVEDTRQSPSFVAGLHGPRRTGVIQKTPSLGRL
ncbi:hypothetical protein PENANT_c450G09772, partial [Penicillium antarcticum]